MILLVRMRSKFSLQSLKKKQTYERYDLIIKAHSERTIHLDVSDLEYQAAPKICIFSHTGLTQGAKKQQE